MDRFDEPGLPEPHGRLFSQRLANLLLLGLPARSRFLVEIDFVFRQLQMLDGELLLQHQHLIGKMARLLTQLGIDRELMRTRLIL